MICSVSAYVQDGQPMNINHGAYSWLNLISPNIKQWFSEQVSLVAHRDFRLEFLRDGDSAACAIAGSVHTAVIMLGSSIGAGFAPLARGYRPMAADFHLEPST